MPNRMPHKSNAPATQSEKVPRQTKSGRRKLSEYDFAKIACEAIISTTSVRRWWDGEIESMRPTTAERIKKACQKLGYIQ